MTPAEAAVAKRREHIARLVATAPQLRADQIARLRQVLAPLRKAPAPSHKAA